MHTCISIDLLFYMHTDGAAIITPVLHVLPASTAVVVCKHVHLLAKPCCLSTYLCRCVTRHFRLLRRCHILCCDCHTRTGLHTSHGTSCCCYATKTTRQRFHSTLKQCCVFWMCHNQTQHLGRPCWGQQCRTPRTTHPCGMTRASCCVSSMLLSTGSLSKRSMMTADGCG
jgi:hypothetical protein